MKNRKFGRLNVAFENIEKFAGAHRHAMFDDMELAKDSSVWRCKNGSLTVCLRYKGVTDKGYPMTGMQTVRGVRGVK